MASPYQLPASREVRRNQPRKGTFSCWECKRRKTRCDLKSCTGFICSTCRRRNTPCVSQELPNPADEEPHAEERLLHVESLVNDFARRRRRAASTSSQTISQSSVIGNRLPSASLLVTAHSLFSRSLSSHLHAFLPDPNKAALIISQGKFSNLPVQIKGDPLKQVDDSLATAQIAQIMKPVETAHPVHFARKLIQLALCLHQLEKPVRETAKSFFDVASQYVTSQDPLMESLDGVETLILECFYHVNMGDMRRAWLVVRRALSIAQLLGLSSAGASGSREESIWARLVLGDRFISWILGLPLSITNNDFLKGDELLAGSSSARLERSHTVLFERIITRNLQMRRSRHYDDSRVTREIDHELKMAAKPLLTSWWSLPGSMENETMEKTEILMSQMHHDFLIIALHQPYVVRNLSLLPVDSASLPFDDTYHQFALLSAVRDILQRFLLLRGFHRTLTYRGIDDKAFTACMMLLLVHFQGHTFGSSNVFEHQRPHDIGVLTEVITLLEETSTMGGDALSKSMADGLRKLLALEASAAEGVPYLAWLDDTAKGGYHILEEADCLSLPIPYFGFIRIMRQEVDQASTLETAPLEVDGVWNGMAGSHWTAALQF